MSGHRPADDASIDNLDGDEIRAQITKLGEEVARWRAKLSLMLNTAVQYELDRVAGNDGIEVIASVASMTPAALAKLLAGDYRPTPKTWKQIERILVLCQASRGVEKITSAKLYFERITELSERRDRIMSRRVEMLRRSHGAEAGKGIVPGPRRLGASLEPSTTPMHTPTVDPAEVKQAVANAETAEDKSEAEPSYPPPAIPDLLGHEQRPDPLLAKTPAMFVAAMRAYHVWAGSPSYREMERRCAKRISYSTFRNVLKNSGALPKLPVLEIFVKVLGGSSEDLQAWATAWRQITMGDFGKIGRERRRPKPESGT